MMLDRLGVRVDVCSMEVSRLEEKLVEFSDELARRGQSLYLKEHEHEQEQNRSKQPKISAQPENPRATSSICSLPSLTPILPTNRAIKAQPSQGRKYVIPCFAFRDADQHAGSKLHPTHSPCLIC
jgi:hypothetical protein